MVSVNNQTFTVHDCTRVPVNVLSLLSLMSCSVPQCLFGVCLSVYFLCHRFLAATMLIEFSLEQWRGEAQLILLRL